MSPKKSEAAVRARARRMGYAVRKSRVRAVNIDDLGGYRLVDLQSNAIVLGERFDATLEEIDEYLDS